jgi:hypothetical protein
MIIPSFPWLERLSIAAGVSGFALLGFVNYGAPGLALGALAGMFIGRSPKLKLRSSAWAAFHEGFPELREQLGDYDPHEPTEQCQAKLSSVRSALVEATK